MVIDIAMAGIAKSAAKNNAIAYFLLCIEICDESPSGDAEYPASFIFCMKTFGFISAGAKICTVSLPKFTLAFTPSIELRARSIAFTHAEQVIPSTARVVCSSDVVMKVLPQSFYARFHL